MIAEKGNVERTYLVEAYQYLNSKFVGIFWDMRNFRLANSNVDWNILGRGQSLSNPLQFPSGIFALSGDIYRSSGTVTR